MSYSRRDLYAMGEPLGDGATHKSGGRVIYGDGGDGGGGATTSTSYSTNLPEYAQPYYQELLRQVGKNIFTTDDKGNVTGVQNATLPQQQTVGFTPLQQQTQNAIAGLQTPGQFNQASQGLMQTGGLGMGAAGAGLGQALSYNPNAQMFGQGAAEYYMNPYQQQVTNTALREAALKGKQDQNAAMLGAIGRGTFGGARNTLLQAEQTRGLNQQLADIQAKGMSDAYLNAQAQFNADQARQQAAQQYGAQLGQQLFGTGLGAAQQSAANLGALGSAQNQVQLANLQAQTAAGQAQQTQAQQAANTAYQNQMAQLNYPKQQLQFYSDILRGNAGALGSTAVNYAPAPSMASQVGGLGLAGLGLAKAIG